MHQFTKPFHDRKQSMRELLAANPGKVWRAPGVWDGLSAMVADQVGYEMICSSGAAISATLGLPDVALYSMRDNVTGLAKIASNTNAAIIADIDTGYGNAVNAYWTIAQFEQAGADAVYIEDQVSPKRCNFTSGEDLTLTPFDEARAKIRAVVQGRQNPDTVVIARIDGNGDEIVRRGLAYLEEGADFVLPIASDEGRSRAAVEKLASEVGEQRLVFSSPPGAWQNDLSVGELRELGVRIVLHAIDPSLVYVKALQSYLTGLKDADRPSDVEADSIPFMDYMNLVGVAGAHELEVRFSV